MNNYLTKPTYSFTPVTSHYKNTTTYGSKTYGESKTKQYGFYDDDFDYYNRFYGDTKKNTASVKIKRHVVIMNRAGRDFEKEYREFEGEVTEIRFNGKDYEVFIPYKPFEMDDIQRLRKEGWHVREMPVPEEFEI